MFQVLQRIIKEYFIYFLETLLKFFIKFILSLYRYKFKFTFTLLLKEKKKEEEENQVHKTKFKTFSGFMIKFKCSISNIIVQLITINH